MPSVRERKIYRLNEQPMVFNLVPVPWGLGYGVLIALFMVLRPPRTGPTIVTFLIVAVVAAALLVAAYRLIASKKLINIIRWHDAGVGGLIGRDLNPVPHRYQRMTEGEAAWLAQAVKQDRQRGQEARKQHLALRRQEAMRKRPSQPGRAG